MNFLSVKEQRNRDFYCYKMIFLPIECSVKKVYFSNNFGFCKYSGIVGMTELCTAIVSFSPLVFSKIQSVNVCAHLENRNLYLVLVFHL